MTRTERRILYLFVLGFALLCRGGGCFSTFPIWWVLQNVHTLRNNISFGQSRKGHSLYFEICMSLFHAVCDMVQH